MRILLIKMSSMGDVFHAFPALTDAQKKLPGLVVDWVVEEAFQEIPKWHSVVDKVYPIQLRQWRKHPLRSRHQIKAFFEAINQTQYDLVLDAQGLLKSVWVGKKINAPIYGFDWKSVREPLASLFYQHTFAVDKDQHAILRLRQLFSKALKYPLVVQSAIEYDLNTQAWVKPDILPRDWAEQDYVVFLHGTTWKTKYWPEEHWVELLKKITQKGLKVVFPWGNDEEHQRALRMAAKAGVQQAWVPETMLSLNALARLLKNAEQIVSVDTGLSHLAAALEVPMVVLYRVTDPQLVGADGPQVKQLASPCAPLYLKKFANIDQEVHSLKGLGVEDVYQGLFNE